MLYTPTIQVDAAQFYHTFPDVQNGHLHSGKRYIYLTFLQISRAKNTIIHDLRVISNVFGWYGAQLSPKICTPLYELETH